MSGLLDRLAGEVVLNLQCPHLVMAESRDEVVAFVLHVMDENFGKGFGFVNPHDDRISCPKVEGSVEVIPAPVGYTLLFHIPRKHEEIVPLFWDALAGALQSGS